MDRHPRTGLPVNNTLHIKIDLSNDCFEYEASAIVSLLQKYIKQLEGAECAPAYFSFTDSNGNQVGTALIK